MGILATAALVVAAGCRGEAPAEATPIAAAPASGAVDLGALSEQVQAAYRLRPDRRFVGARAALRALLGGGAAPRVEAAWAGKRWALRVDGQAAGELGEVAEFASGLRVAEAWAKSEAGLARVAATPAAPVATVGGPEARLAALGAFWANGQRTAGVLGAAAIALAELAWRTDDALELADDVASRALATLAAYRAVTGRPLPEAEALLAQAMGYLPDARRAAAALPEGHPVRLYLQQDDEGLRALAEAPDADERTRLLWLDRLSQRRDSSAERVFAVRRFGAAELSPDVIAVRLRDADFADALGLSQALPRLVLLEVATREADDDALQLTKALRETVGKRTPGAAAQLVGDVLGVSEAAAPDRLEALLARLPSPGPGPFLDADLLRLRYRALFYSGLYERGRFLLDRLSSPDAAADFAKRLEGAQSPTAREFVRWCGLLAKAGEGLDVQDRLAELLEGPTTLGGTVLGRAHEALRRRAGPGADVARRTARALAAHLDGRRAHRRVLEDVARFALFDRLLTQGLQIALRDVGPAETPEDAPTARKQVRLILADAHLAPDEAEDRVEAVLAAHPADWLPVDAYVKWLDERHDRARAQAAVRRWLAANGARTIWWVHATTWLAESVADEGKTAEALALVLPATLSFADRPMDLAARLLADLGRFDEAESLADARLERYGDGKALARLAEVRWRRGRFDEAGALFSGARIRTADLEWFHQVADAFVRVFAKAPVADAVRAAEAMRRGGLSAMDALSLAWALEQAGAPEAAFRVCEAFAVNPSPYFTIRQYRALKAWRGYEAAEDWLRERVPGEGERRALGEFAFEARQWEVLWDVVPAPRPEAIDADAEFAWLMRAAVAAWWGLDRIPDGAALKARLAGEGHTHYHDLARYLLGMADAREALRRVTTEKATCEAAFYFAWKAHADGDFAAANRWYRLAAETGAPGVGEHVWAVSQLRAWSTDPRPFAELQAERRAQLNDRAEGPADAARPRAPAKQPPAPR